MTTTATATATATATDVITYQSRYHLSIQTAPHQSRIVPSGWDWESLDDAKSGARRADDLWYDVRLIDGQTGKRVRYDR